MRKSVKRGLIGTVAFVFVTAGIAALAWRIDGLAMIETLITEALQEQGVPVSALTLRSMGPGAAVLTDIRLELAGGLTIRRVEARYRLVDLVRDRRVERVVLSGVRVDLSSLAAARESPAEIGQPMLPLPSLPVDSIGMQDSAFSIVTPIGEFGVAVDLEARPLADGGIDLSGQAKLRADTGQASVPFTAAVSPAGGFDLTLAPEFGRLDWRGGVLDFREGRLILSGTLAGLRTIDGALAADVTMPDGSAAQLTAVGRLIDDRGQLEVALDSVVTEGRVGLTAAVVGWGRASPAFDLAMEADMQLLRSIPDLAGVATGWISAGTLNASLSGIVDRGADGADPQLGGRLAVEADLTSAEPGHRFKIDLGADLAIETGAARLKSNRPSRLSWWQGTDEDAITLTFGDVSGGAFEATVGQVGNGWTFSATGPYGLADRHGLLSGALDLTASADRTGDRLAGRFAADFDASGSVLGAVMIDGGRAELAASFDLGDGRRLIRPDSCMPVMAERLAIGARLIAPDGVSACLAALPDHPLIEFAPGASDGVAVNFAFRPDPATMILDTGAAERLRLELDVPEATIAARFADDGGLSAEIATSNASLELPSLGFAVDDIALALSTGEDTGPAFRLRMDTGMARSLADPAWFVPVGISGEASSNGPNSIGFAGNARGAGGAIAATMDGRHDLSTGAGRVDIRLDPVSFAPGVRQPVDLTPALGPASISDVAGSLAASARIGWGERLSSTGELRLEDLTLTMSGATVRSIDGTLRADSLFPLSLPDGQVLALAGADIGIALDEGAVAFGVADGDHLSVQGIGFGFADGVLAVEPFQTVFGDRALSLVVMMQGIDLARLSRQFPVEGLSLTGHMDGRVPIRLNEDTISIENGVLESTEAGVIRYVATLPLGPEGEGGVALLLNAVQNFQYEGLRATINGKTGGDLEVAIRLTGANPELYDGFPIALNINLSGALDQVLQSGLRSMAIADEAGSLLRGE